MPRRQELNILAPRSFTRRSLLSLGSALAGGLVLGGALDSCASSSSSSAQAVGGSQHLSGPLNFFTWSLYSEAHYMDPFISKEGVKINATSYSSADEMVAKLKGGGTRLYDMVVPEYGVVQLMAKLKVIEPMNPDHFSNLGQVLPQFKSTPQWGSGSNFYGVPMSWGSNAIAYNAKLTDGPITSIDSLFDPKYKQRIAMRNDSEDSLAVGAFKLGIDNPFAMNTSELAEVKKLLISQKPLVRAYWTDISQAQSMLASGDIALAWSFLTVVEPLRKQGIDARWCLPKEGSVGWTEGISAVAGTQHLETVEAYADWTISSEYGTILASKDGYSTTNSDAIHQMSPSLKEKLGIDLNELSSVTFKVDPPNKAQYDETWNEVLNA